MTRETQNCCFWTCDQTPPCPHPCFCISPTKKRSLDHHIIHPLLTKLVKSRWLDVGIIHSFAFLLTSALSQSMKTWKKLSQYPAMLISHLGKNEYLLLTFPPSKIVFPQPAPCNPKHHCCLCPRQWSNPPDQLQSVGSSMTGWCS